MKSFEYKKSVQVINFFAEKEGGKINKMKSLKLMWLADRLHLRMYGRPIVGDTYFALKNGPVGSETRDILEQTEFARDEHLEYSRSFFKPINNLEVQSISKTEAIVFSKTDIKILETIYKEFGSLDQFQLVDLSHIYPEWRKFEDYVKNGGRKKMSYLDFFLDPPAGDRFFNSSAEAIQLAKEYYLGS